MSAPAPSKDPRELVHDLAKGGPMAAVMMVLGWLLLAQLDHVEAELAGVRAELTTIKVEAAAGSADRWTASDHHRYAREVDVEIRELQERVTRLEAARR